MISVILISVVGIFTNYELVDEVNKFHVLSTQKAFQFSVVCVIFR